MNLSDSQPKPRFSFRRNSPVEMIHPCNLLSYGSAISGILALQWAPLSSAPQSVLCIALASSAILDSLDGKFARLFPRSAEMKNFGMQLDNFIDLFAFGTLPWVSFALLHHTLAFPLPWTFWSAAFLHFLAAASRLGFYSIRAEKGDSKTFIGVPTTLIGMIWALVLGTHPGIMSPREATLLLVASAVAMVSPIRVPRPSTPVLIGLILGTLVLIAKAVHQIMLQTGLS
jgi:phosphatidylserine synthase